METKKLNIKPIITIIVIVCLIVGAFFGIKFLKSGGNPEITNTLIASKLEAVSDLTTAKLTYNGLLHYEDGKIPILTKKAFFMTYQAEVRAGFDLSKVEVDITDHKVEIIVPKAEIQDIAINTNSISFYNEKAALLNWEKKQDAVDAMKAAEEDVRNNANINQLKQTAENQMEALMENLFEDMIGTRTLVLKFK